METMKMNDHTMINDDYDDDEYVKVEKVDDYMEFGMEDDDVKYVKVGYPADDLENEYPVDDLENKYPVDDLENKEYEDSDNDLKSEDMVEGMEIKDPYDDVLYDKEFVSHFAPSTKAVEIKDLVKDIVLPYLPAKSIARFKSVSKEWDQWIKSPFLAHQQSYYFKDLSGFFVQSGETNHTFVTLDQTAYGVPTSSFLPEDVNLLSSSNGLLLCQGPEPFDTYYVCNPATQNWTILPSPTLYLGYESAVVLAFDPSVLNMEANYHVLRVISVDDCVYFDIYSSQTLSWEVSGTILVDMEETRIKGNSCFYMNGIVYMETSMRSVIAFDLFSEVYEFIPLPFECPTGGVLTQIEGELCYVGVLQHNSNTYSIMVHAGMELSLKRQLCVSIGPTTSDEYLRYRVLPCLDGDNVMVLIEDGTIYTCSTRDGSVEVATRVEMRFAASTKYLPYVNSLVHVA